MTDHRDLIVSRPSSRSSEHFQLVEQENLARRLLAMQEETGYEILQRHGQRITGGPPPNWPQGQVAPGQGTEVYCYRVPRDCFEDELMPVFSRVGRIYELRLMIEFSGFNRTYCYVRYYTEGEAREAISKLNNFPVRPGSYLAVTRSFDNKKLLLKLQPCLARSQQSPHLLQDELSLSVEGVARVALNGFKGERIIAEFVNHRLAALARRQLVPGNVMLFESRVRQVDWVDPVPTRSVDIGHQTLPISRESSLGLSAPLTSSLGNGSVSTLVLSKASPFLAVDVSLLGEHFNQAGRGQLLAVRKEGERLFLMFDNPSAAELACLRSQHLEIEGERICVSMYSHREINVWEDKVVSTKENLATLARSLGWGPPSFLLVSRISETTLREVFQSSVTIPGSFFNSLAGDWISSIDGAEESAAIKALDAIIRFSSPPNPNIRNYSLATASQCPDLVSSHGGVVSGQSSV